MNITPHKENYPESEDKTFAPRTPEQLQSATSNSFVNTRSRFVSKVGTEHEDDEVSDDRLEELFAHQVSILDMTRKEYIAVVEHTQISLDYLLS